MLEINWITTENVFYYPINLAVKNVHYIPSQKSSLHRTGVFALKFAVHWNDMHIPRMLFLASIKKWNIISRFDVPPVKAACWINTDKYLPRGTIRIL